MRRHVRPTLLFVAGIATVVSLARSASAAGSARLVYVRGNGADSCPDEAALRSAVAARVGYDPFFAYAPLTVVVDIHRRDDAFAAHIQLVADDARSLGTRELVSDSPSCASLIDAMSLAISIALDAQSVERRPVAAIASAPDTPVVLQPSTVRPERDAVVAPPPVNVAARARDVWTIGGGGGASIGETPGISPDAFVFGAWRRAAFSLGFEARGTASGSQSVPAGTVSASAYSGSLIPCLHTGVAMFCAVTTVGWLRASGSEIATGRDASAAYIGLGPRVGFELPVAARWSIRVHGDLVADLRRTTLRLNESDVWTAPGVYLALGTAVATHFP